MKFKYSVIGDNSQENREWLEKVGYINFDYNFEGTHIICYHSHRYDKSYYQCVTYHELNGMKQYNKAINCIGNPQFFQAVSAISTRTDIGKHYINNHTGQWKKCDYNMAIDENIDWNDWTEVSLDELQERFKVEH